MSSDVPKLIRKPKVVYRRSDPAQFVLRQGFEGFSDEDLQEIENDITVYVKHGVASSMLEQLMQMSRQITAFSEPMREAAA